jgi:hypothetical protein
VCVCVCVCKCARVCVCVLYVCLCVCVCVHVRAHSIRERGACSLYKHGGSRISFNGLSPHSWEQPTNIRVTTDTCCIDYLSIMCTMTAYAYIYIESYMSWLLYLDQEYDLVGRVQLDDWWGAVGGLQDFNY